GRRADQELVLADRDLARGPGTEERHAAWVRRALDVEGLAIEGEAELATREASDEERELDRAGLVDREPEARRAALRDEHGLALDDRGLDVRAEAAEAELAGVDPAEGPLGHAPAPNLDVLRVSRDGVDHALSASLGRRGLCTARELERGCGAFLGAGGERGEQGEQGEAS